MTETKDMKIKEKQEVSASAEHMKPGLVFSPSVDIFESDTAITLLADMPGVAPTDITIDLKEDILTIIGEVKPIEAADETDVLTEFEIGKYYRQFSLSEIIAQDKIEAKSEYGVLRLVMPKAAKAIPRKIMVAAG